MDLRGGIFSTANYLGIDPYDLATAISYETAGTFDPTKRGPTTQWGQHRGLIQFGEPQAKKYGVDWNDPLGSQLGPDKAIARYLKDTGVKPGMEMLDIYSAINAGGVGRYNRSDANNGGAPGTVRDKVEKQMAGHRRKAEALLGGPNQDIADETMRALGKQPDLPPAQRQPTYSSRSAPQMEQETMQNQPEMAGGIFGRMFPNMTREKQDSIAMALSGLSMHPNQGMMRNIAARQDDRRASQKESAAQQQAQSQKNRTIEYIATTLGRPDLAQAVGQGVLSAKDAYAMANQTGEKVKGVEINGRLVNPYTGEEIANYADPEGDATTAVQTLKQRAAEAGLEPGTDAYRQFMLEGGSKSGISLSIGPNGEVSLATGGQTAKPLTEAQSKDTVYATRAEGALPTLDRYDTELSQIGEKALDADPTGIIRGRFQSDEYQLAKQAGQEFLQAILRKDTGAAITTDEQILYGGTYLPQPGDGTKVIEQKRQSRKRALAALKSGMTPQAILRQEKALLESGSLPEAEAPTGGATHRFNPETGQLEPIR